MFAKSLLGAAGLGVALIFGASSAFAAPYLSPTGDVPEDDSVQLMEDNDWETLLRFDEGTGSYEEVAVDVNTVIQAGDLFAGVLVIQSTELAPAEGDGDAVNLQGDNTTFTAIFLIEAESVVCSGVGCDTGSADTTLDTLQFTYAGTDAWEDVYGSGGVLDISSVFDITDLDQSGADVSDPVEAETMALLFEGVVFSDTDSDAGDDIQASAITFVDGGTLQYEFGFTEEDGATEFWTTTGIDAAIPSVSGTFNPTNKLSLNITEQWDGPGLDTHNYRGEVLLDADFGGEAQLQGFGNVVGVDSATGWGVFTDTDLYIRPLPEPASLALVGIGLVGLGFFRRRKKVA